jgi:hypothetical protein
MLFSKETIRSNMVRGGQGYENGVGYADVLSRVLEQAGPGIADEDLDHIAVAAGDQDETAVGGQGEIPGMDARFLISDVA